MLANFFGTDKFTFTMTSTFVHPVTGETPRESPCLLQVLGCGHRRRGRAHLRGHSFPIGGRGCTQSGQAHRELGVHPFPQAASLGHRRRVVGNSVTAVGSSSDRCDAARQPGVGPSKQASALDYCLDELRFRHRAEDVGAFVDHGLGDAGDAEAPDEIGVLHRGDRGGGDVIALDCELPSQADRPGTVGSSRCREDLQGARFGECRHERARLFTQPGVTRSTRGRCPGAAR